LHCHALPPRSPYVANKPFKLPAPRDAVRVRSHPPSRSRELRVGELPILHRAAKKREGLLDRVSHGLVDGRGVAKLDVLVACDIDRHTIAAVEADGQEAIFRRDDLSHVAVAHAELPAVSREHDPVPYMDAAHSRLDPLRSELVPSSRLAETIHEPRIGASWSEDETILDRRLGRAPIGDETRDRERSVV